MDKTLSAQQQRAILRILEAEVDGTPLTRLLRTPYSCRWCGQVCGRPGMKRDERKALLAAHEDECRRQGKPWHFIAAHKTYYAVWRANPAFLEALEQARHEVTQEAITTAAAMLQMNTISAVRELARQVTEAEKESDRRLSAVAILDRADVNTAAKGGPGGVQVYLPEVDDE